MPAGSCISRWEVQSLNFYVAALVFIVSRVEQFYNTDSLVHSFLNLLFFLVVVGGIQRFGFLELNEVSCWQNYY